MRIFVQISPSELTSLSPNSQSSPKSEIPNGQIQFKDPEFGLCSHVNVFMMMSNITDGIKKSHLRFPKETILFYKPN